MMDAAIAFRVRPVRTGLAYHAIIVLRLPIWPKASAQDVHQRQQLAETLDRERIGPRNLGRLGVPLMNG